MCQAVKVLKDKGIAHRDLKPENILINKNFEVKIIDFSFASKLTFKASKTITGTTNYIAPETWNCLKIEDAS